MTFFFESTLIIRITQHGTRAAPKIRHTKYANIQNMPCSMSKRFCMHLWLQPGEPMHGAVNPLQSQQVRLNGALLQLLPGPALPAMRGSAQAAGTPLSLPASSVGFVLLPDAKAVACM